MTRNKTSKRRKGTSFSKFEISFHFRRKVKMKTGKRFREIFKSMYCGEEHWKMKGG